MQVCCRDRNRLALQGDLLAAQALGVPNVMAVTGDEITHGDHHQAKPVHDLELLELLAAIKTLQTGRDLAGVDLNGAAALPGGRHRQGDRRGRGPEAGTGGPGPQNRRRGPVFYHPAGFRPGSPAEIPRQQVGKRQAAIIPTVMLLKSVGMARYINAHMEMKIPESSSPGSRKAPTGCASVCRSPRNSWPPQKNRGFPECSSPPSAGRTTPVDPGRGRFIAASGFFDKGWNYAQRKRHNGSRISPD